MSENTATADSGRGAVARKAGAPQGLTLAIAGFLPVLTILSLAPAVPSLMRHFADVPMALTLVPLMVTAPGLMVALLAPFAGLLVDRFGRRKLILIATGLYGFAGVAPFFLDSLAAVFASRLLVGVTETFILVIVNALFADYFDVAARRTWITAQGISGPILGTGSIALAGALTASAWNGAFLIYLAAFLVFFAMLAFFFEPDRPVPVAGVKALTSRFPWRVAAIYCGVTLFASIFYYVFIVQSGLAFEASGVESASQLGMLIGISSLGTPLGALLFNMLSRRLAADRLIVACLVFMGVGMIGMGLAPTPWVMLGFGFLQQIGAGITVTALIFWVSQLLSPEHRGRGFGFWSSAFFAGQFISPLVVGLVRSGTGGILSTFATLGFVAVLGAGALLTISRRLPRPI